MFLYGTIIRDDVENIQTVLKKIIDVGKLFFLVVNYSKPSFLLDLLHSLRFKSTVVLVELTSVCKMRVYVCTVCVEQYPKELDIICRRTLTPFYIMFTSLWCAATTWNRFDSEPPTVTSSILARSLPSFSIS